MPSINERLQIIVDELFDGNKAKFAKSIEIAPTSISNYLSDKRQSKPSADMLEKIINVVDNLSADWLLTGEGEMLNNRPVIEVQQIPSEEKEGEFFTENTNGAKFYDLGDKYRMIVKIVPFCAYGSFANETDTLEPDREDWEEESFDVSSIVHGNYLSFEVKGESMDNGMRESFEAGDRVLVRELNRAYWMDRIRYNDYPYWVVVFDSSVLIKEITNQDIENGIITFHSLNPSPEYSDFTLCVDDIRRLYYVVQKKPRIVNF